MAQQIVTRDDIAARARAAFREGRDLSDNPFPWHSAAYVTWNEEWLRLASAESAAARAHHPQLGTVPLDAAQALDLAQSGV
ncbi:MAG TPA: hypothetical protein VM406_16415 [Noviherbaspirillum sp.]|nr:hypothetical protein [Noviherbaspirillum sp.]